jgi:biotin carboxyl carrier protein
MTVVDIADVDVHVGVLERLVIAPGGGRFRPAPPDAVTAEGEIVHTGQIVGHVESGRERTAVVSAFTGFLMGMLAEDGERVRAGQPIAWLRTWPAA